LNSSCLLPVAGPIVHTSFVLRCQLLLLLLLPLLLCLLLLLYVAALRSPG
jgi:hypothetical protein